MHSRNQLDPSTTATPAALTRRELLGAGALTGVAPLWQRAQQATNISQLAEDR